MSAELLDRTVGLCLEELRRIARNINSKKGFGMIPSWIFDLENCGSVLTKNLQERSRSLGYSGNVKEDVPELQNLRNAINKIGGICATGGFALSKEAAYDILVSAIRDIEEFIENLRYSEEH